MNPYETILKHKFEMLFREHFTGLCYFTRKYTGDLDSAKEIVHSIFIKIWENRLEFDWDRPAKSYLYTSAYNRSLNLLRDRKKFISHDDAIKYSLISEDSSYADHIETAELESRIKSAIKKLPGKCREIFELSRFEGKKYAEISKYLNISVKTVETQMSKALLLLKTELKDYLAMILLLLIKNMDHW